MTHAEKLKRIEQLMASPDVIEFETLAAEVDAFEKENFPISSPTLPEAMQFRRGQTGETQKEISARAGMTLAGWKRLEAGEVSPSITEAKCLYSVGIPADVILARNVDVELPLK